MLLVRRRYSIAWALETEAALPALNRSQRRTRREAPAGGTATERASPALTSGAYEFDRKRLEPAPQPSPYRRFKVPATRQIGAPSTEPQPGEPGSRGGGAGSPQRSAPHLNRYTLEMPQESELDKLG